MNPRPFQVGAAFCQRDSELMPDPVGDDQGLVVHHGPAIDHVLAKALTLRQGGRGGHGPCQQGGYGNQDGAASVFMGSSKSGLPNLF